MTKDVVCGMQVDEAKSTAKSQYKGKTYYFCGTGCKTAFDKDPNKYAMKSQPIAAEKH